MAKKFNFIQYMSEVAETEDDVRHAYVKEFDLPFSTKNKNDCRTDGILFEFKYDKPMRKADHLAGVV